MKEELITLGENLQPPVVDMKITQDIYDCVRTNEFDIATFNSLLMAVVTYLDAHEVQYGDRSLPWAELMQSV
jgi:hypothetical protein